LKTLCLAFVACASATQWFAKYDMPKEHIAAATTLGCYRGVYGGVRPRSMSLLTCAIEGAELIAETVDDAFLCVIELKETSLFGAAEKVVIKNANTAVLWQGAQELIIANTAVASDMPEVCDPLDFLDLAHSALHVPVEAIKPVDATPMWHSRVAAVHHGAKLEPNPIIADLVDQYNNESVKKQLEWLATDYQQDNTRVTRNSYAIAVGSGGCREGWRCANHVVDEVVLALRSMFRDYSGKWQIKLDRFRTDMCPNIVLELEGEDPDKNAVIVTGAHLDSRNTGNGPDARGEAPGADDNASGSAVQLEMARIIAMNDVQFKYSMRILWFCGEEQGLLGSRALARSYRQAGDNLLGMFNMDMIGYTIASGVTMSFMTDFASAELTEEIKAFSKIYVPHLAVGNTGACCSDQMAFHKEGFRAAGIFETPTASVVYPQYHRTGDTWDNGLLNYEQIHNFGQGLFSAILEYATPLTK